MPTEVLELEAVDVGGSAGEDVCVDVLTEDPDAVVPQFMTLSEHPDSFPACVTSCSSCGAMSCNCSCVSCGACN